jgi:hypothetical protein
MIEVQALPAPADAGQSYLKHDDKAKEIGPFQLDIPNEKGKTRPMILDPENIDIASETPEDVDCRMFKTTNRTVYDSASTRARKSLHPSQ